MFARRRVSLLLLLALCVVIAARAVGTRHSNATWTELRHISRVVDLAGPTSNGSILIAADGRLDVMSTDATVRNYAPAYRIPSNSDEPYIALSSEQHVASASCSWPTDDVYALRLTAPQGVTVISPRGRVSNLVDLHAKGLEDGIAFDLSGRFGYRLLVTTTSTTSRATGVTTVTAISCNGHVQVLTRSAPRVEGGLVVAPQSFGRFGGDLLAPDENTGKIYAIGPNGQSSLVARSGLPSGGDIGVESLGIVPASYSEALVADRGTPHNAHPGDNAILGVSRATLADAGVKPGDLIAVNEGGATAIAVRCSTRCHVQYVGHGPSGAHVEGHVIFTGAY